MKCMYKCCWKKSWIKNNYQVMQKLRNGAYLSNKEEEQVNKVG